MYDKYADAPLVRMGRTIVDEDKIVSIPSIFISLASGYDLQVCTSLSTMLLGSILMSSIEMLLGSNGRRARQRPACYD